VQGSSARRFTRIAAAVAFVVAFMIGATLIFAAAHGLGFIFGLATLPDPWRLGVAGAALLSLAAVDVAAAARATYCPITLRRQTPRILMRRYRPFVVSALWGLDTGLVVTTFRVAAVSWAALLVSALALVPLWAGLAYGAGFVLPFSILLWRPQLGRAAATSMDPGLEAMLRQRSVMQRLSAALLLLCGALLIGGVGR
jgi:hypothetical protein